MGNRIAKLIKDGSDSLIKATYYVRDAQGNVMTVYQWQINDTTTWPEHIAAERYIYGSSRLGVETTPVEMIGAMPQTQDTAVRFLQYKHYEISNHLGNVLAVVSDKKVLKDTNSDLVVDEYHPDMVSANDYSPFGVYLYGRTWSAGGYRYGFNGMEKDDEVKGSGNSLDFGARIYDPRLGRWLSVDPLIDKYPTLSPYSFVANNPIKYLDPDGERIRAGTKAQTQVQGALLAVFGVKGATLFHFDENNELKANFTRKEIRRNFKGRQERLLARSLLTVINDDEVTNVVYQSFAKITFPSGNQEYKSVAEQGGELTEITKEGYPMTENTINISPEPVINTTVNAHIPVYAIYDLNGSRIGQTENPEEATVVGGKKIQLGITREIVGIQSHKFSNFFHGLGHILDKRDAPSLPNNLSNAANEAASKHSEKPIKNRPEKDDTHND